MIKQRLLYDADILVAATGEIDQDNVFFFPALCGLHPVSQGMGRFQRGDDAFRARKYRECPQRRIVAKVDELMTLVDALETQITASRAKAAQLMEAVVAELTAA